MDGMTKDQQEAEFNEAFIDLMGTANDDRIAWIIEHLWCFHRLHVIRWVNRALLKHEIPERE